MSEEVESSRGGASSNVMFLLGMCLMRCWMIWIWICFVWSGVRRCLLFVCLASLVRVPIMTVSFLLNVVCLILSSVWERVYVSCRLMLKLLILLLLLLLLLMPEMALFRSAAVVPFRLLSWKTKRVGREA